LANSSRFWRLFPNVPCLCLTERHSANSTAHCFGILLKHKWSNKVIEEGLVPTRPEQVTDPNKAIATFLLVLHPFPAHSFEHTISNSIHEPTVRNTCANIRKQLFANFSFVIAFAKNILCSQNTRPNRHTHAKTPHEILKAP